jgi:hypothetical protein
LTENIGITGNWECFEKIRFIFLVLSFQSF